MGLGLSLYTVFEIARTSVPTVIDSLTGRLDRERSNRRLEVFARNVVRRAAIDIDVRGSDNVPGDKAFVFMSNHQSHLDVPVLYYSIPVDTLRMVGKTELFRVPIWGRAMRAGEMIEIDRSDRDKAIASLRRAGDAIADGVSIWIAPEGRRTRTGELGALKRGGFYLARDTGTPIIPVAISGSFYIMPPETLRMKRGVRVRVDLGAPIPTADREIDDLIADVGDFLREHVISPPARL